MRDIFVTLHVRDVLILEGLCSPPPPPLPRINEGVLNYFGTAGYYPAQSQGPILKRNYAVPD